jgi:hypothetical protein
MACNTSMAESSSVRGRPLFRSRPRTCMDLVEHVKRRAYGKFNLFGGARAYVHAVGLADVLHDRRVNMRSARPYGGLGDDAAQRQNGRVRRAAADIHNEGAYGLLYGQPRAYGGGHGLVHQKGGACARASCGFLQRPFFHIRHAAGYAQHRAHTRAPCGAAQRFIEEMLEHRFAEPVIRDYAVLQWAYHLYGAGSPPQHQYGIVPYGDDALFLIQRYRARLAKYDAGASASNQRIDGTEVYAYVDSKQAGQTPSHLNSFLSHPKKSMYCEYAQRKGIQNNTCEICMVENMVCLGRGV